MLSQPNRYGHPNRDRQGADAVGSPAHGPLAHTRGSEALARPDAPSRDPPAAYLITFRTYASWLPGDARGSVDRLHNQPGTPLLPPNSCREQLAKQCADAAVVLSAAQRNLVGRAVSDVCNYRKWDLHAINVRSNHVHLVVCGSESPERIMSTLKAWATRRMRQAGLLAANVQPWSRHGSTRYLWNLEQVEQACIYVQQAQDEPR